MTADPAQIAENVARVHSLLASAAADAGRAPDAARLVAVSKTVDVDEIRAAVVAGVTDLGENYVNELRHKRPALADLAVRWHYVGALQSGTAHHVADLVDVVQTVAGERAAHRLAGRAARAGRTIDVLIEVDFTGVRAGVGPDDLPSAVNVVEGLDGLHLRGLMTVAPLAERPEEARPWFRTLRELRDSLQEKHPDVLELSMGMSLDYGVAVQEGATMVRIGTAVFGTRALRERSGS